MSKCFCDSDKENFKCTRVWPITWLEPQGPQTIKSSYEKPNTSVDPQTPGQARTRAGAGRPEGNPEGRQGRRGREGAQAPQRERARERPPQGQDAGGQRPDPRRGRGEKGRPGNRGDNKIETARNPTDTITNTNLPSHASWFCTPPRPRGRTKREACGDK